MEKEMKDQFDHGNFTIMRKSKVLKSESILPTLWQKKRKRDIITQETIKHKARLNIDGSKMKQGIHFTETHAPVANWNLVRLVTTIAVALS